MTSSDLDLDEPPALVEAADLTEVGAVPDLAQVQAIDEPLLKVPITIVTGMSKRYVARLSQKQIT